jgi:predicted nucleic acid-binding Zn ribbon protein
MIQDDPDDEHDSEEHEADPDKDLPDPADCDPDDDPDATPLIDCPYCGKDIYEQNEWCPHCGNYITKEDQPTEASNRTWMFWTALAIIIALAIPFVRAC